MNTLVITLDLDWACEAAIEETLDFFASHRLTPTIFSTHPSARVEKILKECEVGLHPFFDPDSSQGATIREVVEYVTTLPHNLPAFRCHRFGSCNSSIQAMVEAGMKISSNVCSDLEAISPFRNRFGIWEVPIFFEDGGYLLREHPLEKVTFLQEKMSVQEGMVFLLHPMHFVLNTPHFGYMRKIKDGLSREAWQNMGRKELESHRWKGRGIRDLFLEVLQMDFKAITMSDIIRDKEGSSGCW